MRDGQGARRQGERPRLKKADIIDKILDTTGADRTVRRPNGSTNGADAPGDVLAATPPTGSSGDGVERDGGARTTAPDTGANGGVEGAEADGSDAGRHRLPTSRKAEWDRRRSGPTATRATTPTGRIELSRRVVSRRVRRHLVATPAPKDQRDSKDDGSTGRPVDGRRPTRAAMRVPRAATSASKGGDDRDQGDAKPARQGRRPAQQGQATTSRTRAATTATRAGATVTSSNASTATTARVRRREPAPAPAPQGPRRQPGGSTGRGSSSCSKQEGELREATSRSRTSRATSTSVTRGTGSCGSTGTSRARSDAYIPLKLSPPVRPPQGRPRRRQGPTRRPQREEPGACSRCTVGQRAADPEVARKRPHFEEPDRPVPRPAAHASRTRTIRPT